MIEHKAAPPVDRPLGRAPELAALGDLLDRVENAHSVATVLAGEAGAGKSALVEWAVAEARRRGFLMLRATGVEFERDLPYSGLSAVLRPLLDGLDDLPAAQATAVRSALGLLDGEAGVLSVNGAALALVAGAAERAPVLVAVDDVQWLDRMSLASLVFAAHRCDADRVGFLFAERSDAGVALDWDELERLTVGGLDREPAVALLARRDVVEPVAARCWELTHGNPLALVEAARALTPGQRAGDEPLPTALPLGTRLLHSLGAELSALPEPTLMALGAAALDPEDDAVVVAAALARIGGDLADLCPAEAAGVVTLPDGRVAWRHPLLRAAVIHLLGGEQRRRLHRGLAEAASEVGDHDRALWHLSQSVLGPDEKMAARMAEVAAAAHRRGSLPAASRAYEQAARLTIDPLTRAEHMTNAAWALVLAGDHLRARDMAAPLADGIEDVVARARMAGVLGVAELWIEGPAHVIPSFELHGRAVRQIDPAMAAVLLLHSSAARMLAMDLDGARGRAQEAGAAAQEAGDPVVQVGAAIIEMGFDLLLGRNSAAAGVLGPLGRQALAGVVPGGTTIEGIEGPVQACAYAYIVGDDVRQGIDLLRPLIHLGDARVLNGGAMFSRLMLVDGMLRLGWWADALAEMSQLISLQRAVGLDHLVPVSYAQLARVEAGLGLDDACREHAEAAIAVAGKLGIEQISSYAISGLGLLELGAGRWAEAADQFDRLSPRAAAAEPGWLWWEGDAIEALFRSGRTLEAERALARLERRAAASGRAWAQAVALRAAALLGRPGAPAEERYAEAIARFRSIEAPFEEARTRLLRGEHRLREGREADGAVDVAAARTLFDRLGARAWSTRASSARGEVAGVGRSLQSRLTEAELRVALAVGHGLSNRQAAEDLFLSIKTVDFHLQGIYRKLGVRNRTQLAAIVLASAGG